MRELSLTIAEDLQNGLRPNDRLSRGDVFLTELHNLRPTEFGLDPVEEVEDPFSGNEVVSFPFPQLFRLTNETLLFGDTSLKSVDESTDPWSTSSVSTYDTTASASLRGIPSGGPWHVADLQHAWYAFNGSCVMFKTGLGSLHGLSEKVYVQDSISVQTGAYHKGRVVMGGFDSANFWPADWQSIFSDWQSDISESFTTSFDDIDSNWVVWGSIGQVDLPLWLFYPNNSNYTYDLDLDKDRLARLVKQNMLGWMRMPWQGTVRRLLPLGENLIVYGDEGVTALVFDEAARREGPPTYGKQHLLDVGIPSRGAAGGSRGRHLFVTKRGELWTINSSLEVQKLDYSEFLSSFTSGDVVITNEESDSDFFLSSSTKGFIFTGQGLCETKQRVTQIENVEGKAYGLHEDSGDTEGRVVTTPISFGNRNLKTITGISLEAWTTNTLEVAVDYRYEKDESFTRTDWHPVGPEGHAFIRTAGVEFRVAVRVTDYSDLELDSIMLKWQKSDRRYTRGPNASSTIARTG